MAKTIKRIALFLLITSAWVLPVATVGFALTQEWFGGLVLGVLCIIVALVFGTVALFLMSFTWLYCEDKIT